MIKHNPVVLDRPTFISQVSSSPIKQGRTACSRLVKTPTKIFNSVFTLVKGTKLLISTPPRLFLCSSLITYLEKLSRLVQIYVQWVRIRVSYGTNKGDCFKYISWGRPSLLGVTCLPISFNASHLCHKPIGSSRLRRLEAKEVCKICGTQTRRLGKKNLKIRSKNLTYAIVYGYATSIRQW